MRLTEPGLYVARDGRVAVSYMPWPDSDMLCFCIRTKDNDLEYFKADSQFTEGEWQQIDLDAVQWPELPPKPLLVLILGEDYGAPQWRSIYYIEELSKQHLKRGYYKVVPHPDNDPEAVAMIEAARKEANDANT